MEFELSKILEMRNALLKILNSDLPIKISYKLSKSINKLNAIMREYEIRKAELFKKYGEQKGAQYCIKEENKDIFLNEMNELLSIKEEIDITKIKLSDIESVKLSAIEVNILNEILEE